MNEKDLLALQAEMAALKLLTCRLFEQLLFTDPLQAAKLIQGLRQAELEALAEQEEISPLESRELGALAQVLERMQLQRGSALAMREVLARTSARHRPPEPEPPEKG